MTKYVTIGLRMDSSFVRLLNANVELSQLRQKDELDPLHQLGLLALMEARGAPDHEVHASILHAWRPHLEAVTELRRVEESQPEKVT